MSSLFVVSNSEGELILTSAGYVLVAVIVFSLFALIAACGKRERGVSAKQIAFSAAAVALAIVTSYIKLIHMPMGGSATLCSMLFLVLIGYWYGPAVGIMAGLAYGCVDFILNPYIVSLPQVLVDYPLAYGALGISGFFSHKKNGLLTGYIAGVLGRYFFATLSGVIFFGMYAPENMGALGYSLAYNGGYLGAEAAITIVLLLIPAVRKAMAQVKTQALA
ncbi:MAG: energy-coupled thiamine transporter ThiT [Lachnospiraceae bacterium]|nr:energy-coupled thiamine transporter ThiT [Lachnospiraceae bacterium]